MTAAAYTAAASQAAVTAAEERATAAIQRIAAVEQAMPELKSEAKAGADAAPFARVKWAGSTQKTDATGKWTQLLPAGLMTKGIAIIGPVVRGTSGYDVSATVGGSVEAGYSVTLQFTKRKQQIGVGIPAIVLGAAATTVNVALTEATAGVVTFDVGFAEPDVIG